MDYKEHGNSYEDCSIWASWGGYGLFQELTIYGHFECNTFWEVAGFELQIALLIEAKGKFEMVDAPAKAWWEHLASVSGEIEGSFSHSFACHAGDTYFAWVYGRQTGSRHHTQWWASGIERESKECKEPLGNSGPPPVPTPPKDG